MSKISPILKWAGGKRQLLSEIIPLVPSSFNTYFEPFVGAGAVLLELQPQRAIVNDANTELIIVYEVIRDNPDELIALLREHEANHSKDYYYQIRDLDRNREKFDSLDKIFKAARMIYLNRTCFNGLYRVNRKGYFNTPMGRNSSIQIVNETGIQKISQYLNSANVSFLNSDYRTAIETVSAGDFVFLDPPYFPTNRDSFVRYDMSPFGVEQQHELKAVCDQMTQKGIPFIETNSDCDEIRELYADYRLIEIDVRRSINAKIDGRRGKELIILNY